MSDNTLGERRELSYKALADPTRRHLLRLLDDALEPIEVGALAEQLGLHPNTVRDHLELLRQAGLVTRVAEKRERPGRPKMLYSSLPQEARSPGFEGYRFLAEVLAGYLQAHVDDPAGAAEEAGRAWGRYMVNKPEPFARPLAADVLAQIVNTLVELGFAPEEEANRGGFRIRLHDCPFREVAQTRTEVVCGVHLGILRGMAEELGGSVLVDDLIPFFEPSMCVVELSERPPGGIRGQWP